MIACVAVAAAVYAIDKPYSYSVPDGMSLTPGMRVIVPFGRGNRRSEAIVLEIANKNQQGLKSIECVLDDTPILSYAFIRLAAFIRERYFCTFYDAIKAMLPAGLWFDALATYTRLEKSGDTGSLSSSEIEILEVIDELGGSATHTVLKNSFSETGDLSEVLQKLIKKKYITADFDYSKKVKDKTEKVVCLAVSTEQAMDYANKKQRSAPLQYELLKLLCSVGSGSSKELCYLTGATGHTIRRLEELGYIVCSTKEIFRSPLPAYVAPAAPLQLTNEQDAAFRSLLLQSEQETPGVGLLYGVTGSGKTSVYIRLIQEILNKGKSALFLVPEISLTPQLIGLLMSYIGEDVAVMHSALRVSERYDTWKRINQHGARVVVGTRSAIFAPLSDLGLVIVDEEQEHTYKSESNPRYHAREVAIYRGAREQALVVLGSATPSIETMYLANTGVYSLNTLNKRYNRMSLPKVDIVDMKQEIRNGNSSDISTVLKEGIQKNLSDGKQTILFLNRRGAGRCLVCTQCGDVPQCPRCSVSLTYHRANHRLMCHHCGHSQPVVDRCEQCGGHVKTIGTGTQRLEQELQRLFPDTPVLRMDADSLSALNTHEMILSRFSDEKIPILIGTQMVTKGLNFENVTLVGVIDADMSLYVNHYRASETTFSMLTQVIGRAGRGSFSGRAIIQTMTPQHTVLQLAAEQDYSAFYELENTLRMIQHSPPHGDLITVTFISVYEEAASGGAFDFRKMLLPLCSEYGFRILGPTAAPVLKVNNSYRHKLTICCKNSRNVRLLLSSALKEFSKNKKYKGVTAYADINSYE